VRLPENPAGIPYTFVIPGIGRQLMLMSPNSPRKHIPGGKALRELAKSTGRTIEVLDGLSQSAIDALSFRQLELRKLMTNLRILHVSAEEAAKAGVNFRDGAPKKTQAQRIAIVVAQHYCGLTGKIPTLSKKEGKVYGPFFHLLKDVYEVLGVKASAESQASDVIRNWKSIAAGSMG
jgi:hypothetical protein